MLLVLRDDDWDCPLVPLMADEIVKDDLGQEAVLDRLLDLLLIAALRAWFDRPEAGAPGFGGAASPQRRSVSSARVSAWRRTSRRSISRSSSTSSATISIPALHA